MDTGNFITAGVGLISSTIVGINNANKQKEVQKYIAKLNQEQKIAIAEKLAKANTDIERQRILFQTMALEKNLVVAEKVSKDKLTGFIILGGAVALLGVVVFLAKKK